MMTGSPSHMERPCGDVLFNSHGWCQPRLRTCVMKSSGDSNSQPIQSSPALQCSQLRLTSWIRGKPFLLSTIRIPDPSVSIINMVVVLHCWVLVVEIDLWNRARVILRKYMKWLFGSTSKLYPKFSYWIFNCLQSVPQLLRSQREGGFHNFHSDKYCGL